MKALLSVLLIVTFTIGCQNEPESSHANMEGPIVLDDGNKWEVPAEMMKHIKTMEFDAKFFNDSTLQGHAALAGKLKATLDELTSNCTMKGQGHDELHKWLLPHIDNVDAYMQMTNLDSATAKLEEIKASFDLVNDNFL
jgi:hypothetical protein